MTWNITETTREELESVVKTLIDDSSDALLFTQSEHLSTKTFIEAKIKFFDCSLVKEIEYIGKDEEAA